MSEYDDLTMGDIDFKLTVTGLQNAPFLDVPRAGVNHHLKFVIGQVNVKLTGKYQSKAGVLHEMSVDHQVKLIESLDDIDVESFVPRETIEDPLQGPELVKQWAAARMKATLVEDRQAQRLVRISVTEQFKKQIYAQIAEELYEEEHPDRIKPEKTGGNIPMVQTQVSWL